MRWCGRDLLRLVIIERSRWGTRRFEGAETAGTPVIAISCRGGAALLPPRFLAHAEACRHEGAMSQGALPS